ncbi:MAG: zonular occludens toxin domain-containing protein, partial [Clostridia bacterium]
DLSDRVFTKCGKPRCGKSSSGAFLVMFMAYLAWKKLSMEIIVYRWKLYHHKLNDDGKKKYVRAMESYVFYKNHIDTNIPCLFSNMPMKVGNRLSFGLSELHLLQIERLPYCTVIYIDEVGTVYSQELFKLDDDGNISDPLRLCGHYGWWLVGTEQEMTNIYKDFRRVVSYNEIIEKQKACGHSIILFILDKLFESLVRLSNKSKGKEISAIKQSNLVRCYIYVHKIYWYIGWRHYKSRKTNGDCDNGNAKQNLGKLSYYLPSSLNCKYDDEYCFELYKCKDKRVYYEENKSSMLAVSDFPSKMLNLCKQIKSDKSIKKAIDKTEQLTIGKELAKEKAKEIAKSMKGKK